jgi:hypothetical protein
MRWTRRFGLMALLVALSVGLTGCARDCASCRLEAEASVQAASFSLCLGEAPAPVADSTCLAVEIAYQVVDAPGE